MFVDGVLVDAVCCSLNMACFLLSLLFGVRCVVFVVCCSSVVVCCLLFVVGVVVVVGVRCCCL